MRPASILIAAVAAALALAGPAAAKELTKAEMCGPAGCAATTDRETLMDIATGGEQLGSAPRLAPFYELKISSRDDVQTHTWTIFYVPSANMLGVPDGYGGMNWHPIFGSAIGTMRRLAERVEPHPAPRITAVAVDGRLVEGDPSSYLRLFDQELGTQPRDLAPLDWVSIDLRSAEPSPWTSAGRELMYSPSANVLERRSVRVVLPDWLAADVEAGRTLADDGFRLLPWLVLAGLAGALLALALLGARLRGSGVATPAPKPVG